MQNLADLYRYYTVVVNNGSGCIFQPDAEEFTYVLTVKHNLTLNEEGNAILQNIQVSRTFQDFSAGMFLAIKDCFVLKNFDYALILLESKIENEKNYNLLIGNIVKNTALEISGYPKYLRNDIAGSNWCTLEGQTSHMISINAFFINLNYNPNTFDAGAANNILGYSGSGIFYEINGELYLSGIFPGLNDNGAVSQRVNGLDLSGFGEIIKEHGLPELLPYYLRSFRYIRDLVFSLDVDSEDEISITKARISLRNETNKIIDSNLTPTLIKDFFKDRLLVNSDESYLLTKVELWKIWLEFLVIINMCKAIVHNIDDLNNLFGSLRLYYCETKDWTLLFKEQLIKADYKGLIPNSTVIIGTSDLPKYASNLNYKKGKVPYNIRTIYDSSKFKTDTGLNPLESYNFIHIEHFHRNGIIDQISKIQNINEESELTEILKNEFKRILSEIEEKPRGVFSKFFNGFLSF